MILQHFLSLESEVALDVLVICQSVSTVKKKKVDSLGFSGTNRGI